ncbi:hypothetical protein HN018_24820 (plasmid) [Lichenicola cladoniae]|uniref:Uncharacterized protein n=1 Tax=Lichenicola cladoniae TaxID=1484109 RepID=A0A6M8HXX8_9PROT|nr:hypothetical protein [Lichenicola cladoniae]NPD70115.1 hypothetical protein [Acetobacteraceae bacterium]QKE93414.1 hypothetical protein HN018_24820 [Lichenicola cladoniae]
MISLLLMLVGAVATFVIGWCFGFRDAAKQDRQTIDALTAPWDGIERRQDTDGASV